MTPRDRIRRYSQIIIGGALLIWLLLCFFVAISPRLRKLSTVNERVASTAHELAQMRKQIEDARIVGGPSLGPARFDKFGILSTDEEQLFLTDLIAFCKETTNTLNLVRRSDWAQPAPSTPPADTREQSGTGRTQPQTASGSSGGSPTGPPQPVILRVPHIVSFSGNFLSAFYLLRKLESYRRLLTVEKMDLATDTFMGYPRLNGNITIELYLVKQPVTSPTAQASRPVAARQMASRGQAPHTD